jgi:hypothetical protein
MLSNICVAQITGLPVVLEVTGLVLEGTVLVLQVRVLVL